MFVWHMPDKSEHQTAWTALQAWLGGSGREARWTPPWRGGAQKRKPAFSWTILLGGNGTGKSQLAREFGRHITRSGATDGCSERLRSRVDRWWRRIAWWRTVGDAPWDAGPVARNPERLARLKEWLPRAPTLLILDDLAMGYCAEVIGALASNQEKFWYPVRLLIVDQFIPADRCPILRGCKDSRTTAGSTTLPHLGTRVRVFRRNCCRCGCR